MDAPRPFIHGLDLGRMLYGEAARPIIESVVARDSYAAAFLGAGSDALGLDTERSADHDWGPRFKVFLAEEGDPAGGAAPAALSELCRTIEEALERRLPETIHGVPVRLADPLEAGPPRHRITVTTIGKLLEKHLGRDVRCGIGLLEWLSFPEQRLVELTCGEVFHDPRGELARVRRMLLDCPRDVWLFKMACQWQRIAHAEPFPGRCAETGDLIGARIVTARICRDAMRLCFIMERRPAPYDKWLATVFRGLRGAPVVAPLVEAALMGTGWPEIEESLAALYRALAEMHNGLGVTGPLDPAPRDHFGRPYAVIRAERFANALLRLVESGELRRLTVRMGAIDQFVDCTDYIDDPRMYARTLKLYEQMAR